MSIYNLPQSNYFDSTIANLDETKMKSKRKPGNVITVSSREVLPNRKQVYVNDQLSELEKQIINSANPIVIDETQEISANNISGIWLNKSDNDNWAGPIPLEEYKINSDPNPQIVTKTPLEKLHYIQNINIRYLQPPQVQEAGDIIIRQLSNKQLPQLRLL